MLQTREQEIQRQFLDEAETYLDTLEAAVLGISGNRVDGQKLNAALRAAHSIKGGAGMMSFHTLSTLAHQLEDSFKVLKTQKSIAPDADLECLLLNGIGCLRQVIEFDRSNTPIDAQWLETHAQPVFEQLHQRLGDPQEEDATSILSPEEGQDIVPLLFETEVNGCLERLETVLADPDLPCLQEEVKILAQELGGLGEMLQLVPFQQLCASVTQALETAPAEVVTIAQLSLKAWRQTQALVLTGQRNLIPTCIDHPAASLNAAAIVESAPVPDSEFDTTSTPTPTLAPEIEFVTFSDDRQAEFPAMISDPVELAPSEPGQPVPAIDLDWSEFMSATASLEVLEPTQTITPTPVQVEPELPIQETKIHEYKILEAAADPELTDADENATVRVSVRQLNQLNDTFGELTIERNALALQFHRLRSLTKTLTQRIYALEKTNVQFRKQHHKTNRHSLDFQSPQSLASVHPHRSTPSTHAPNFALVKSGSPHANFDSLELDHYDELDLLSHEMTESLVQIREVTSDLDLSLDETGQTIHTLNKTARQLQTSLTHLRMRPLADIVDRFPRAVREMSLQYKKPVQLTITGETMLIDRPILEALNDPLLHLIRNAFDHGIEDVATRRAYGKPETGLIEIQATSEQNRTLITIRDDGGGIPLEKIRQRAVQMGLDSTLLNVASDQELLSLIFEPGFSTTAQVTALSGRGVGMDVVRDRLRQVRGEVTVDTQAGVGTTFTLSVPHTLSNVRIFLVESDGLLLAFPVDVVTQMLLLDPSALLSTAGNEVLNWQGTLIPLLRLSQWLQFNGSRPPLFQESAPQISVLIVNHNGCPVGLHIDRYLGEQEVPVRRVEGSLPLPRGFSSCTILGDGRVVPLVNLPELLGWITNGDTEATSTPIEHPNTNLALQQLRLPAAPVLAPVLNTLLIIDDSVHVRRFLALTLERGGYRVTQAKDGQDALEQLQAGLAVQAIVCDIEMPRLDGFGFLAKLKADRKLAAIPVTMLTSRSSKKHQQLAFGLGASAYFAKPYNEQSLLRTIAELIRKSVSDLGDVQHKNYPNG